EGSYISQTKRWIETKTKEHKNNIKLSPSKHNMLTTHRIDKNHNFDFNNVKVLHTEQNYKKRLILVTLYRK
ncbi:GSCOCG00011802001-RA-CDS, partial [Cotesia congregata]